MSMPIQNHCYNGDPINHIQKTINSIKQDNDVTNRDNFVITSTMWNNACLSIKIIMNTEELRDYCLSLPNAVENQPWTEPQYQMLVTFKVGGKWFCLLAPDKRFINVKCSPEVIAEMQSKYDGYFPHGI